MYGTVAHLFPKGENCLEIAFVDLVILLFWKKCAKEERDRLMSLSGMQENKHVIEQLNMEEYFLFYSNNKAAFVGKIICAFSVVLFIYALFLYNDCSGLEKLILTNKNVDVSEIENRMSDLNDKATAATEWFLFIFPITAITLFWDRYVNQIFISRAMHG